VLYSNQPKEAVIVMTTGFVQFDTRILDLVERENECNDLFEEIRNGNGEKVLRYIALRDSCKELRKEILRSAVRAGLTRERIKSEIKKARNQTTATNAKQT
jgi:hypothetical protein